MVRHYETIPGFNIALRLRHNFGMYSFIWGLEYAQMKFVYDNGPNPEPNFYYNYYEKTNLVADQLRIPLLFQINIGKKRSQFFANGGLCVLFGLPRYADRRNIGFGDDQTTIYYPGEIVKEINLGFIAAVGYSYQPIPRLRIFTEARFILPMVANNNSNGGSMNDIRTLGISGIIGISFRTSKK